MTFPDNSMIYNQNMFPVYIYPVIRNVLPHHKSSLSKIFPKYFIIFPHICNSKKYPTSVINAGHMWQKLLTCMIVAKQLWRWAGQVAMDKCHLWNLREF